MNNAVLIASRELGSYIRTPSGYLIAAVMLAWQGLMFNVYALGPGVAKSTDVLLRFFEIGGGTAIVTAVLFSMRLMAEERASGTQTLLFTSPVREGEIVAGKFAASLLYLVIVIGISVYLPALVLMKGKISWGHVGAGYLGMLLCGAYALSVGAFASTLVKHPFLAVLLSLFFVALLEPVSFFASRVVEGTTGEVLAVISGYYAHYAQSFRQGIVQLSDVVFFLGAIYFWLLAAVFVVKGQRWR